MAIDSAAKTAPAAQGPSKTQAPASKSPPKPDDKAHRRVLEDIKSRLDDLQEKLRRVNEKINDNSDSPEGQKREELREQLDKLREKQADHKKSRGQSLERLRMLVDSVSRKKRELKASKDKIQFKTVKEIDQYINKLEKEIESGELKLIEEKRHLSEITNLKRSRKQVEQFESQQNAIDADQREIENIRKELDESDIKETNAEYDRVKSELDDIQQRRNGLYDERHQIRDQISHEHERRRQQQDTFTKQSRQFYEWLEGNRRVKAEQTRQRQEEQEAAEREERAKQKLEDAEIPAFTIEIAACESLIKYFRADDKTEQPTPPPPVSDDAVRQPDTTTHAQGTMLLKKSDRDDDFFAGSKPAGKHKKGGRKQKTVKANERVHFDVSILEQLFSVDVPVPSNHGEVEITLTALEEKKKYYLENQDRVTKENIEKAKAELASWNLKTPQDENGDRASASTDATLPAPVESKDEGKK